MRYVLAIAALVLSGVLLLLGIGQRTFLAGPSEISFPVDTKSEAGYAVVDGAEFGKVPGQANVVVKGERAFVATGATRDVRGWVEPFQHADLTVDTANHRLLSALVAPAVVDAPADGGEAEAPEPLDPRGSDLWLEERAIDDAGSGTDTGTLRVPVALSADQSVLIASDGGNPVPKDVSLIWVQNPDTPWAGPLLAAGGLLALVGGVLYLLAIDHDRRGLGPRRGRRGPLQGIRNTLGARRARRGADDAAAERAGDAVPMRAARPAHRRGRAFALPALGLAVTLGLSGCSASYWPQFGAEPVEEEAPAPQTSVAPVPVKDEQLHRIVERVAAVANASDDALDSAMLSERFTGDALDQRAANYTIRAAMPDYGVVPPRLTEEELDYELVQSTESWPRTLFVTIASEPGMVDAAGDPEPTEGEDTGEEEPAAASPSLALILTQETPQQNYMVSRVIALRGGISMPPAAPAEEGTALLSNELETLVLPPGEVGTAFAAVLQNGADAPEAEAFDLEGESLLENYGKARADASQQQSDDEDQDLEFSVAARQGDEAPVALSTGVGGALVATTVIEEQIVEGGRYKPQAQDAVTALSGLEGEQDRLVQEVAHQLLFFVPSKTDGSKIQLLGVTSELVGVRN
ncbi:glycosyltransferase [Leucobacter triazinivorans]|uniref:Glycosyltransferase n=1 Tax=Leucobacter triazinivorans TaxID=1784719 RepID=A0A4V0Z1A5_9MICO|nr:glycosyltransferase [Leucobacter triazinivorans]QBE47729.1 glycosyltransferase [Leucobacter triazinivorans]